MDLFIIWIKESDGTIWCLTAWDSDSMAENPSGWEDEKDKAYKEHGSEWVLVTKTSVDFDKVQQLFAPQVIANTGIEGEDS